jgi:RND family efflux transporter MFP subunit
MVEVLGMRTTDRRRRMARCATLLAGLLGAAGCGGVEAGTASAAPTAATPAATPAARPTAAAETARETFVVDTVWVDVPLALPAQLYVERDAVVAARAGGTVEAIHADLGEGVRAGARMATIESADQRIALAQATAADENARRLAARVRALMGAGGSTPAEAEQAELVARQAALTLAQARRAMELTAVPAPFAGRVSARYVRARQLVAPGDTLFRVTEPGPLLARVRVPEEAAGTLAVGMRAEVLGGRGVRAPATVQRVAPAVDAASGTREVVLRLRDAAGLLPGSSVSVHVSGERRRVLAVERAAVGADGYVLVMQGGRPTLRAVTLGADLGDGRVEVSGGLAAGERVSRPPA